MKGKFTDSIIIKAGQGIMTIPRKADYPSQNTASSEKNKQTRETKPASKQKKTTKN